MIQQKVRVGLLGVGLDTYWGQFEGLIGGFGLGVYLLIGIY